MATRSLNRVQLIGNLTRDPELRYTPSGTAVCSFGLATNRSWTTDTGEKREETEFHRIVSWNKLAELCSQLCTKGRKVYVEGRISTRSYQASDGTQRTIVEIVIDDMILLDSKRPETVAAAESKIEEQKPKVEEKKKSPTSRGASKKEETAKEESSKTSEEKSEDINPEDIPF